MNVTTTPLEHGQIELTIEVTIEETKPYLDRAANRLATKHAIPGFRPGKAPLHIIMSRFGEMNVYQEALDEIVTHSYYQALKDKTLSTVGQPEISIEKFAPNNPIVYKAKVALMPSVTLENWQQIKVSRKKPDVADSEIDKIIDDLRNMQATEHAVERPAQIGDKVEINFTVKRDGVVIDGGTGAKYPLILGKGSMIPGFEDKLVGMKGGDTKDFTLTFPSPYYQEGLAGKDAQFDVEMITVYERVLPEASDEWSHKMVGKPYQELRSTLHQNLMQEKEEKEQHRLEQAVMEALIEKATFSDIPEVLMKSEMSRIMHELEDDITARGMQWDEYLKSLKKTKEELEKDFVPHAEKRVKSALILRTLGTELHTEPSAEEIAAEIKQQREMYHDNAEAQENINSDEYRHYVSVVLTNRKTIAAIIAAVVGE